MDDTYTVLTVAIERLYFQKLYCDRIDTNVQLKMRASTAPLIFVKITHQNYVASTDTYEKTLPASQF
jgi:hypothetical protein